MKFIDLMGYYDYKKINIVRALYVARETVNAWKKNDYIPFKIQCFIQIVTDGKLTANKKDWAREQKMDKRKYK